MHEREGRAIYSDLWSSLPLPSGACVPSVRLFASKSSKPVGPPTPERMLEYPRFTSSRSRKNKRRCQQPTEPSEAQTRQMQAGTTLYVGSTLPLWTQQESGPLSWRRKPAKAVPFEAPTNLANVCYRRVNPGLKFQSCAKPRPVQCALSLIDEPALASSALENLHFFILR